MGWRLIFSLLSLALGVVFCWAAYGEGMKDYLRKGDDYGAQVTILAMIGSFFPFVFGAMIVWGP